MEMWGIMVIHIHINDNTVKSAYFWHVFLFYGFAKLLIFPIRPAAWIDFIFHTSHSACGFPPMNFFR